MSYEPGKKKLGSMSPLMTEEQKQEQEQQAEQLYQLLSAEEPVRDQSVLTKLLERNSNESIGCLPKAKRNDSDYVSQLNTLFSPPQENRVFTDEMLTGNRGLPVASCVHNFLSSKASEVLLAPAPKNTLLPAGKVTRPFGEKRDSYLLQSWLAALQSLASSTDDYTVIDSLAQDPSKKIVFDLQASDGPMFQIVSDQGEKS